jgi:hypothetical protein
MTVGLIGEIYAAYKPTRTHRIYSISQKTPFYFLSRFAQTINFAIIAKILADVQFLLYLCTENEEVIYHSTRGIEACAAACVLCAMQFSYRGMVVRT